MTKFQEEESAPAQPSLSKKQKTTSANVVVMDGGMGRELLNMGVPQKEGLWSATALVEEEYHPQVVTLHERFIAAGARTLTTVNYAVQPTYYSRAFPADWEERMVKDSQIAAELACRARENAAVPGVKVLGCLPPLVDNHRPDLYSEYVKEKGEDVLTATYEKISSALVRGGVDVLLMETVNSWREVQVVLAAVKQHSLPVWISMSGEMRDEKLDEHPESSATIAEELLAAKAAGTAKIEMLSFNCATPEKIMACLEALKGAGLVDKLRKAGIHLGVYANCCDFVREKHWDVRANPQFRPTKAHLKEAGGYAKVVRKFVLMGASHVGGCCGCTPDMIKDVSDAAFETVEAP